jgi:hypothetical protein
MENIQKLNWVQKQTELRNKSEKLLERQENE